MRIVCTCLLLAATLSAQPVLRLKSGSAPPNLVGVRADRAASLATTTLPGPSHLIVQFAHPPGDEERERLEALGVEVLAAVPDNAWIVTAPGGAVPNVPGIVYAGALRLQDRLSAKLIWGLPWQQTSAVIEWHRDVAGETIAATLRTLGVAALPSPDLRSSETMVRATMAQIWQLATLDPVLYIYPAAAELERREPVFACLSAYSGSLPGASNLVSSFGEGWDGPGQNATSLTYWIGDGPPGLSQEQVRGELVRALAEWAGAAKIRFSPADAPNRERSLDVRFVERVHGDGFDFDGPGGVVAHSFYPPPNPETLAGDLHLDLAENWRIGFDIDLFSVALHEAGHMLGLAHSDDVSSVMYPYYRRYGGLSVTDRDAIRQLYLSSDAVEPEPEPDPDPSTPPSPPPTMPLPLFPVTPPGPDPGPDPGPGPVPEPPAPPDPAPSAPDRTAPSLTITSPAGTSVSTTQSSIVVRGYATDDSGTVTVTWETNFGASGTAGGAAPYVTGSIPLYPGSNRITVRAKDGSGNAAWRSIVVTRR